MNKIKHFREKIGVCNSRLLAVRLFSLNPSNSYLIQRIANYNVLIRISRRDEKRQTADHDSFVSKTRLVNCTAVDRSL